MDNKLITYSEKVDVLESYLHTLGFTLIRFGNLPSDISGRTFYKEKEVHLNCGTAENAFHTLLHEAVHCLSYHKYYVRLGQKQPDVEKRELYAYLYGWVINKQFGFGVTKEDWKKQNEN